MKRFLMAILLLLLAVLGGLRFIDFVQNTDLQTGFIVQGSVLTRYALLAVGVIVCAVALLYKRKSLSPVNLGQSGLVFTSVLGIMCEIFGVFLVLQGAFARAISFTLFQGIAFICLGAWCLYTCAYTIKAKCPPKHGALIAVIGGIAFYLTVLERFLTSPSSLHRIWPVIDVLSMVASLQLYTYICVAIYNRPNSKLPLKRLCFFGLLTFYFSTCMQLPCAVYLISKNIIMMNDFVLCVIFGIFGIVGAITAQQALAD